MDGFAILARSVFPWQDWVTLGLFFVGMALVVWYSVRQKEETSADYFLAGRAAGWLAIGSSIWASNIGSEHLVGLAGAGAKYGLAYGYSCRFIREAKSSRCQNFSKDGTVPGRELFFH